MLDYKQKFTEARWDELCKLIKEKGMKINKTDFTISEIMFIINETPLKEKEKQGAIDKYINNYSMKQLSEKYGYEKDSIEYHRKKVSKLLRLTCNRIFQ